MSYDLMVFDAASAPVERAAFMAWYEQCFDRPDDWNYDDPSGTTPALRAWFEEMRVAFPAMNGPFASDDDSDRITGYTIGPSSIYVDFRWSAAEAAYDAVRSLAVKHGVGFFDVLADEGEILRPA